jgi:isoleucyl-tRNA synthetase
MAPISFGFGWRLSDYHADIRISPDIMKQLLKGTRKIRNTARYILGNLADFQSRYRPGSG